MSDTWATMKDRYLGERIWLICGGPSVRGFDVGQLNGKTAAINEIGIDLETDFWLGNDNVDRYPAEFWQRDTLKLLRTGLTAEIKAAATNLIEYPVAEHHHKLRVHEFMTDRRVCWGAAAYHNGGTVHRKSIMLAAFGVLYRLGFREVALLGCDWSQNIGDPYAHNHKNMTENEVRLSNLQFDFMEQWFAQLLPLFRHLEFKILNCTDGGGLNLFERADWREISRKWENQTKSNARFSVSRVISPQVDS